MPRPPPTLTTWHQSPASSPSAADRQRVGLELEDLRADVGVQPDQLELRRRRSTRSIARAARPSSRPKPNFESSWPVAIVVVGRGLDPGRDPDQHPLRARRAAARSARSRRRSRGSGGRRRRRAAQQDLLVGLVVAVHVDARRVEAGRAAPCAARRRRRRRPRAPPRRRAGRRRCREAPCWRRGPRSRRCARSKASR